MQALTYRAGHHSTSDDSSKYRPIEEIEWWRAAQDPLCRFRKWLEFQGWWTSQSEAQLRDDARREVRFSWAKDLFHAFLTVLVVEDHFMLMLRKKKKLYLCITLRRHSLWNESMEVGDEEIDLCLPFWVMNRIGFVNVTGTECNSSCREDRETIVTIYFHRCIRRSTFQPPRSREITSNNSWKASTGLSSFSILDDKSYYVVRNNLQALAALCCICGYVLVDYCHFPADCELDSLSLSHAPPLKIIARFM